MRFLVASLVFVISLVATAAIAFFTVIFLAGPHGGALPASLHSVTIALGWIGVVVIPPIFTGWAWRRAGRSR